MSRHRKTRQLASLLVVLALLVAWPARADSPAAPQAPAAPDAGDTLYVQTDGSATTGSNSQVFPNDPSSTSQGADDFVVTGAGWDIDTVQVIGNYQSGVQTVDAVRIQFYTNGAANLPATLLHSTTVAVGSVGQVAAGDFVIPVVPPLTLAAANYWVSVAPVSSATFWQWTEYITPTLQGAAWRNPLNGWGTNCTNWALKRATCNWGTEDDYQFVISGTVRVINPVPVLTALTPNKGPLNTAITVTVSGFNFMPAAIAKWNDENRTTQYVDSSTLKIFLPASDLDVAGVGGAIEVFNPGPTDDSNALTFTPMYVSYLPIIRR